MEKLSDTQIAFMRGIDFAYERMAKQIESWGNKESMEEFVKSLDTAWEEKSKKIMPSVEDLLDCERKDNVVDSIVG